MSDKTERNRIYMLQDRLNEALKENNELAKQNETLQRNFNMLTGHKISDILFTMEKVWHENESLKRDSETLSIVN